MLTRRALLVGAGAVASASALAACATAPSTDGVTAKKPDQAPLHGLVDWNGGAVTVPKILGAVTIVDFWASWCGPCRQAMRYMDQLYRTYKADGLSMIGVCVDDDPQAGRRFWALERPHFQVAWDPSGEVRERFSVASLPTTVLFDPQGFLVQRSEGFDPADHRLLEEQVHRLLRT
ncbi:MAG TPA: TlpA disulfide reductase family protein [Myxococcota bacterium]|jgi:thiol-disulfide isomerase/thioredoxin